MDPVDMVVSQPITPGQVQFFMIFGDSSFDLHSSPTSRSGFWDFDWIGL